MTTLDWFKALMCVCVCVCYLNVATQLQVGQPMTKLLSGFVLPSHTSSMQPAVHISHTQTWAFCLKWLADLGTRARSVNARTHTLILTLDLGINPIHPLKDKRSSQNVPKLLHTRLKIQHTLVLTWLWRSPVCRWTGRGVGPESASRSSTEHVRAGETTYQSWRGRTGPMGRCLGTQEPGSSLWITQQHMEPKSVWWKTSGDNEARNYFLLYQICLFSHLLIIQERKKRLETKYLEKWFHSVIKQGRAHREQSR